MVEDSIDYGYKCPDCNWNINDLEIKNIIGYKEQIIFCEQCGARLVKYIKNDLGEEVQNKQEIEKNSKRYPVEIIANDPDFTDGFIDDLTLVLSRMIYLNIRMLEKNHKIDIEKIEFDEKLLNFIADTIMPILSKEINLLFLKNLHNLSREDFNANLIKLQSKLSTFHIYRQNFIIYFRWLIKETFFIVSESWNKLYLEVFDKIIIEDLKQYNFEDIYSLVENSKLSEYFEENVHGAFFNPIIKFLGKKMPDGSPNIEYYAKEVIDNYWKLVMNTNMRMIGFDSSKMKWKDFSITASQLKVLEQGK